MFMTKLYSIKTVLLKNKYFAIQKWKRLISFYKESIFLNHYWLFFLIRDLNVNTMCVVKNNSYKVRVFSLHFFFIWVMATHWGKVSLIWKNMLFPSTNKTMVIKIAIRHWKPKHFYPNYAKSQVEMLELYTRGQINHGSWYLGQFILTGDWSIETWEHQLEILLISKTINVPWKRWLEKMTEIETQRGPF